jgi:Fe-S-cluster containining protein
MLVFLNAFDIERLLEISHWSNWLDFAELDEAEIKDCGDENFPVMIDGRMLFPVLKMQAESENCLFLGFEQGLSGCKIWKERPLVCRTFPFEDSGKGIEFIKEAESFGCKASSKSKNAGSEYLNDLKKINFQALIDRKIADAWNLKGSGKKEDFVEFVLEGLKDSELL